MDKKLFRSVQNNFRQFLQQRMDNSPRTTIKNRPIIILPPTPTHQPQRIVEIERTTAFGKEDDGIGYRISLPTKTKIASSLIVESKLDEMIDGTFIKVVYRSGGFDVIAFLHKTQIGKLQIRTEDQSHTAVVLAADVNEPYQHQGVGTELYKSARKRLKQLGVKLLMGALEGSGIVQIREKVFGAGNTKYYAHGKIYTAEEAIQIMDVEFGRVIAKTTIR